MATLYQITSELPAGTAVLQPADAVPVQEAATGRTKYLTGSLLGSGTGGVVVTTATAVSLSATVHGNKLLVINTNSSSGCAVTLPAATGTGVRYDIINGITQTQGSITIVRAGSDVIGGRQISLDSTAVATHQNVFVTTTATTMTWNRTTTGAATNHDHATLWDAASGVWKLISEATTSGDDATPFS